MQEADKSRRNKGLITAILAVSSWDGFSASWRTPCLSISAACQRSDDALLSTRSVCRGAVLSNFVLNTLVMKKPISGEPATGKCIFPGV